MSSSSSSSWTPPTPTTVVIGHKTTTKKREMPAPVETRVPMKDHMIAGKRTRPGFPFYYLYATWVWLLIVTALVIWLFVWQPKEEEVVTTTIVPAVAKKSVKAKRGKHRVKIYPFNIYDNTEGLRIRYPAETGGIPDLVWNDVRYFKTCCKNENAFQCFPTDEVVLKRDPERSLKNLPDVYLEITRKHPQTNGLGAVGSRCQLMWSVEHADIED